MMMHRVLQPVGDDADGVLKSLLGFPTPLLRSGVSLVAATRLVTASPVALTDPLPGCRFDWEIEAANGCLSGRQVSWMHVFFTQQLPTAEGGFSTYMIRHTKRSGALAWGACHAYGPPRETIAPGGLRVIVGRHTEPMVRHLLGAHPYIAGIAEPRAVAKRLETGAAVVYAGSSLSPKLLARLQAIAHEADVPRTLIEIRLGDEPEQEAEQSG